MGSPTSPRGGHVVGPSGQLCGTPGGRTTILILTVPRGGSCRLTTQGFLHQDYLNSDLRRRGLLDGLEWEAGRKDHSQVNNSLVLTSQLWYLLNLSL